MIAFEIIVQRFGPLYFKRILTSVPDKKSKFRTSNDFEWTYCVQYKRRGENMEDKHNEAWPNKIWRPFTTQKFEGKKIRLIVHNEFNFTSGFSCKMLYAADCM